MNRSKETIFAVLFSATLFVACSEDVAERGNSGMPISFELSTVQEKPIVSRASQSVTTNSVLTDKVGNTLSISVTETEGINLTDKESDISITSFTPSTRGSAITTDNISSIGVTAYDHTGSFGGSTATVSGGYGFQNESFSVSSQIATSSKKWPVAGHYLSFFAYAPSGAATVANTSAGFPSFSYTASASGDQDLLVTTSLDNANTITTDGVQGRVPLTFNHALSAIIFTFSDLGTEAGTVSVTIGGVYNTNTYTYSTTGGSWGNSPSGSGTYTVSSLSAADGERTTLSSGVLFLMPQTIPDAATLSISYTDGAGYTHAFSKQLKQIIATWEAGHTYNYTIGASAIGDMSVSYPAWDGLALTDSPVQAYTTSDFFGLFAVDATGKILISNLKMQANPGTTSTTLSNVSGTTPFLSDKYTYYLYYPWQSDGDFTASGKIGAALARNNTAPGYNSTTGAMPEADTFFSSVIGGWSIPVTTTDQSADATFKNLDLQVSKYNSGFPMAHKMGLVKITLGTKSVPTTRTYSVSGTEAADATGMRYTDSNETTTVTASSSFDASCSPYTPSSTNYWYIVRGSNADNTYKKTFKSVTTVNTDWEYADVSVNEGNYLNITVNNTYIKRPMYSFVALFDHVAYEVTIPDTDPPVTYPSGLGQSFKAPLKGTYTLKVWGAQGGTSQNRYSIWYYGGYGSYSVGDVTIAKNTDLYIYVGGQGCIFNGGAQGANASMPGSPNSGGATHVALADGELSTLSSQKSDVLIVAGGGGGGYGYSETSNITNTYNNAYSGNGAHAGGIQGNKGIAATSYYYWLGTGGSQTSGGNINDHTTTGDNYDRDKNKAEGLGGFGYGGSTMGHSGGAGGGGWYGGAHSHYGGGAGGSGYIGNTLLSNKHMTGYSVTTSTAVATKTNSVTNVSSTPTDDYAKQGDGYCKISCTPDA